MLKGAIDSIHPHRIGGWVYSSLAVVKGAVVQAFVSGECVGAGRVELMRQDLADAGLGDGYLGFSFPISLADPADCAQVFVRIEDSDFVLLSPQARIGRDRRFDLYMPDPLSDTRIEFMRKNGWLTGPELSFSRSAHNLGVAELSLVRPKVEQERGASKLLDPLLVAADYLKLLSLSEIVVEAHDLLSPTAGDIIKVVSQRGRLPSPFVGIFTETPSHVDVIEGSHRDERRSENWTEAVHYVLESDRLAFVNILSSFRPRFDVAGVPVKLFVSVGDSHQRE